MLYIFLLSPASSQHIPIKTVSSMGWSRDFVTSLFFTVSPKLAVSQRFMGNVYLLRELRFQKLITFDSTFKKPSVSLSCCRTTNYQPDTHMAAPRSMGQAQLGVAGGSAQTEITSPVFICCILLWNTGPSSMLTPVTGRIQFLGVIGLTSLIPCWLSILGLSQLPEATRIPLHVDFLSSGGHSMSYYLTLQIPEALSALNLMLSRAQVGLP